MFNVADWLDRWAFKRPLKTAVIDADEGLSATYAELSAKSKRLAGGINAEGLRKGDRLAVLLENSIEFLELFFACSRLGVLFTPLSFRWSKQDMEVVLKHCSPKLLVASKQLLENYDGVKALEELPTLLVESNYSSLLKEGVMEVSLNAEDPQVLMYTAGTTGRPKGCILPYRKTVFNVLNAQLSFGLTEEDRALCALPLFHSGGLFIQAVPTLCSGGTVILIKRVRGDPHRVLSNLERHRATNFLGVAFHARLLAQAQGAEEEYRLRSMRFWAFGGEAIPLRVIEELQRKWPHIAVSSCYGTTETSLAIAMTPTHREASSFKLAKETGRFPAGKAMFYCDVKLVDEHGKEVKVGEVGEVLIRGPTVFTGYWLDPERTKEAVDEEGWFHTGDLAVMDEEGYVYIVDRRSNVIKSGGEKILATKIEEVILQHPKVAEVAVVAVPDEKWGERPYAFVVPKEGFTLTPEEVLDFCRQHLSKIEVPDYVQLLTELPRAGPSKVARWRLKEIAMAKLRAQA